MPGAEAASTCQVGDAAGQRSLSDMGAQLGAQLRPQGAAAEYDDMRGGAKLGAGGGNAYLKELFEPRDGAAASLGVDAEPGRLADPRLDPREAAGEGVGADYDADDFSGGGRGQVSVRCSFFNDSTEKNRPFSNPFRD